jgi:hypothetical protein
MMRRVVVQCLFGSNPHSNGDLFSRFLLFLFEFKVAKIVMAIDSRIVIVAIVVTILFNFCYYDL